MGWRASDTRELAFVDAECRKRICSGLAARISQFLTILDGGRISVAALSVGLAMGAYDEALAYAKNECVRTPISKFQAIQFKLVDMLAKSSTRNS